MKQILLLLTALLCLDTSIIAQTFYWNPTPSGTKKNLLSISFGSPQVGFISGVDSTLLRTVNGGLSWTTVKHSGLNLSASSPDIIHIDFLSPAVGFAVVSSYAHPDYQGSLYKTIDSGKSWSAHTTGNIAIARTHFFDSSNGFAIGSALFAGNTVIKKTNGSWGPEKHFSFDASQFLYGIDFRNPSTGIVGGYGGYVYRTFNGGASWDTIKTVVDTMIQAIRFLSDGTVIAATDNFAGALIISHDTGRTWDIDFGTLTFAYPALKDVTRSKRDSFIAVGHAQFNSMGVLLWHDTSSIGYQMVDHDLNAVAMRDDSIAYAVGDSGAIYTNRKASTGVSVAPSASGLTRIYPNPVQNTLHTEAQVPHCIELLDISGRVLLQDPEFSNTHSLSVSNLPAGLYVLRCLSVDGRLSYHSLLKN